MRVNLSTRDLVNMWVWLVAKTDWYKIPLNLRNVIIDDVSDYILNHDVDIQKLAPRFMDRYEPDYIDTVLIEQALVWAMGGVEPVQLEVFEEDGVLIDLPYMQITGEPGEYLVYHSFPDETTAREAQYRGEDVESVLNAATYRWQTTAGMHYRADLKEYEPVGFRYRLAMPKDMVLPPRLEL